MQIMEEAEIPYPLLGKINEPADLRKLSSNQLKEVCEEIRKEIINVCSHNPGHLASSLGAVELAVAIHYVYNTPEDRVVWDVGHQAYAHKILTGRRDSFKRNREMGGLKPFPSPQESRFDINTCGHASNSISIGLGLAVAAEQENINRQVIAVIGDGAMSGGLAYEGLNNVSAIPNNMLIILNDNNMSISRSVGGMKQYLHHLHTSSTYNTLRFKASQKFASWGWLNDNRKKMILRFNNAIKSILFGGQQNIFEGLNIRYFGPIDGNDVIELVRTLRGIKNMKGPKLLHVHTIKGKGYTVAEKEAAIWHAPGKFDPDTGKRIVSTNDNKPPKFQDVFGDTLVELAKNNKKIVGVTPAMPLGCSMNRLFNVYPNRAFDVGIAEGHAVTFSAGMAIDGLIPFCNVYSSFFQRAYDNIIHDVAISNLHVVFCLDRAGLVGEDGPTHHGMFDIASLRAVPHLIIASPMDAKELRKLMYTAQLPDKGAFVIRYPRGRSNDIDWNCSFEEISIGKGRQMKEGKDLAVLTLGPLGIVAEQAIMEVEEKMQKTENPFSIAHYDMRFVKPLDTNLLDEIGSHFDKIITIEDGVRNGGFGSAVAEYLLDKCYKSEILRLGLPDEFVAHGKVDELYRQVGLDKQSIFECIVKMLVTDNVSRVY